MGIVTVGEHHPLLSPGRGQLPIKDSYAEDAPRALVAPGLKQMRRIARGSVLGREREGRWGVGGVELAALGHLTTWNCALQNGASAPFCLPSSHSF